MLWVLLWHISLLCCGRRNGLWDIRIQLQTKWSWCGFYCDAFLRSAAADGTVCGSSESSYELSGHAVGFTVMFFLSLLQQKHSPEQSAQTHSGGDATSWGCLHSRSKAGRRNFKGSQAEPSNRESSLHRGKNCVYVLWGKGKNCVYVELGKRHWPERIQDLNASLWKWSQGDCVCPRDVDRLPAAVMGRLNIVSIGPPQNQLPFGFVRTVML